MTAQHSPDRIAPEGHAGDAQEDHGGFDHEVAIIGGGPAGLSAALTLSRARRSVVVIDAGEPRNAPAAHLHGYLSRDGIAPRELLAIGRREVEGYGGQIRAASAVAATARPGGGFDIALDGGGSIGARRLLVTTGLVDGLPAIPGLAEQFGRNVLHCPFCHGWEVRDRPIGIIATSPLAVHQALLWRQWTDDLIVFRHTADRFEDAALEQFAARDITVVEGTVEAIESDGDDLVGVRVDGRTVPRDAVVVMAEMVARSGVLASLGIEPVAQTMNDVVVGMYVPTAMMGATSVPGVWAAGNVANLMDQVISAAAAGVQAGAAIAGDIMVEETAKAVAAYRKT